MEKLPATTVTVDIEEADRRLDNYLMSRLKGVPRSRIYRMIRDGQVRVNKGRARPDRRLVAGDQVRIPPVRLGPQPISRVPDGKDTTWIEERVIYEDPDLLVWNKPSGLAVHGGSGLSYGAIELLRKARGQHQQKGGAKDRLELVHRLDRSTSGCLLIAKRRSSLRRLHEQFRSGDVHKRYKALLLGRWKGGDRSVREPLATSNRSGGERHVRVDPAGKASLTTFMPEEKFTESTLVTADLGTGRTHQIRVHGAHIGHPVAGDRRYGPEVDPIVQQLKLERLFLHAAELTFDSPREERLIKAQSPLEGDLQAVLDKLRRAGSGKS
jgi:23S rRNA pseudouridine955/2504/2580 synthase